MSSPPLRTDRRVEGHRLQGVVSNSRTRQVSLNLVGILSTTVRLITIGWSEQIGQVRLLSGQGTSSAPTASSRLAAVSMT